jgi:hypothetical protein
MRQLIEDLISMMEYHVEQTRPIHTTTVALQAARDALKSLSAQPAPVQEPVEKHYVDGGHIVYPAAQRQWVSLTADERYDIRASFRGRFLETSEFAEQVQLATEAKLKEKNT